jgi:hypothetical protein
MLRRKRLAKRLAKRKNAQRTKLPTVRPKVVLPTAAKVRQAFDPHWFFRGSGS